jgi:outer membrane lipoprotein carrier protein
MRRSGTREGKIFLMRPAFRLLMILAMTCSSASPQDLHSIAAAVDAHYNRLHSLQAEFVETYRGSGMERAESGTVWLEKAGMKTPGSKKPGKMRWEYRSPREKLFVSDGRDAWFYVPGDRQVRKTEAKKLEDVRSPLAFLLGKSKLEKELQGLSVAVDVKPEQAGDVVLRGVPGAMSDRVSGILVEVTPEHVIDRIVVEAVDGSSTEYRFSDQKENVEIPAGRFEFQVPAGVETVEGDLGGQ